MATKPSKTELARLANDLLRSMRAAATLYAQAKQNKENELVSTRLLSETANKAAKFIAAAAAVPAIANLAVFSPPLAALSVVSDDLAQIAAKSPGLAELAILSPDLARAAASAPGIAKIAVASPHLAAAIESALHSRKKK